MAADRPPDTLPAEDPLTVLSSLPARDVDAWRAGHIRKLALLALHEARAEAARPFGRRLAWLARWVLEPAYLAASSAAVLFIAFQSAASLLLR